MIWSVGGSGGWWSVVLEGGRGLLRLLAGEVEGGVEVVETEHLSELHLAERGLAVLIGAHGYGGEVGASQPDEVVQVDLELGLRLSATHADGLVTQDLGAALGGVGSGGRGLLDAQGTPGLLGSLGIDH